MNKLPKLPELPKLEPKFFLCSCFSESISIEYDEEYKQFDLSIWYRGRNSKILSWKERFRWIWRILRTGDPWNDELILSRESAKNLSNFISKHCCKK